METARTKAAPRITRDLLAAASLSRSTALTSTKLAAEIAHPMFDCAPFTGHFEATLQQIGAAISIIGAWLLSDFVTRRPVPQVLLWITLIGTVLSGWIFQAYGLAACLLVSAGFVAMAALVSVALPRHGDRQDYGRPSSVVN